MKGAKLAAVSRGIYYPITQLSQIQQAYDDIVIQLRSAYSITSDPNGRPRGSGTTVTRACEPSEQLCHAGAGGESKLNRI